jgi:hypothetical protein
MDNEARISRLLAVFNDLPDKDKEAVLALMEKLGRKETILACDSQTDVVRGTGNCELLGFTSRMG